MYVELINPGTHIKTDTKSFGIYDLYYIYTVKTICVKKTRNKISYFTTNHVFDYDSTNDVE